MKNSFLVVALLSGVFTAAQAQTTIIGAGTGLLTGSVGYNTRTTELTSSFNGNSSTRSYIDRTFRLDFVVGGFVANNLALGLQLNHTVTGGTETSSSGSDSSKPNSSTLRVGPAVQYYQMLGEQFGLTTTLGAGYESDQIRSARYSTSPNDPFVTYTNLTATGFYAALTPGVIYFPIPKFGLTATIGSLGYMRLSVKDNRTSSSNSSKEVASSLDAGFGISQLQFGGTYYFGRK